MSDKREHVVQCDGCLMLKFIAERDAMAASLERVRTLADEWAAEGPSLVRNAHGARDVHEGSTLEQCAVDIVAALDTPAPEESTGCDCTELCSMGPTCPGGMLAQLPGSGCSRTAEATEGWIDKHGDVWRLGDDGLMHTPETQPFTREHVEKKWGPLRPVAPITPAQAPVPDMALTEDDLRHLRWLVEHHQPPTFGAPVVRSLLDALDTARAAQPEGGDS